MLRALANVGMEWWAWVILSLQGRDKKVGAGCLHLHMLISPSDFIISSAYMHIMYFDPIHPSIAHFCSFSLPICLLVQLLFSCPVFSWSYIFYTTVHGASFFSELTGILNFIITTAKNGTLNKCVSQNYRNILRNCGKYCLISSQNSFRDFF